MTIYIYLHMHMPDFFDIPSWVPSHHKSQEEHAFFDGRFDWTKDHGPDYSDEIAKL